MIETVLNHTDTQSTRTNPSTKSREFAALDGKLRQSLHEFGECDGEHLARPRFQRAIRGLGQLLEDLHDLLNHRLALIQTEILRIALHGRFVNEKHGQKWTRQIPLQRRLCEEQDIEELLNDSTHRRRRRCLQIPKIVLCLNEFDETSADLTATFMIVIDESGQGIDAAAGMLHDRFVVGRQSCDAVPNEQKEDVARERRHHQHRSREKRAQKTKEGNAQFRNRFQSRKIQSRNCLRNRRHQLEQIGIVVVEKRSEGDIAPCEQIR